MVASAKIAYSARRQADFGVHTDSSISTSDVASASASASVRIDMATVRKRKRDIVASFRGGSEARLTAAPNVTLVRGKAAFVGVREVEVLLNENEGEAGGKERLRGAKVYINAGCRPAPLEVPVAAAVEVLDSTSVMELGVVPEKLVVVGGGYVGVEFAQMFRRFGSQVVVVQRAGQLLGREDEDVSGGVREVLEEEGVEVLLGARVESVGRGEGGTGVVIVVRTGEGRREVGCSHLLVAAGRVPNTQDLGLGSAGVEVDKRGFVKVNERLETSAEGVYALGDIKGGPAFTHISYDDFRILKHNVLTPALPPLITSHREIPYTVFIDPQLGRIGLSETEARAKSQTIRVAKMPMAWVARALEMDESRGFMKVVVDRDSDQILGAAVLGIEGGEVMSMLQIAMMGGLPYTKLRDGVFAHPLLAESLNNLFANLEE